jgi:hypothetical protein
MKMSYLERKAQGSARRQAKKLLEANTGQDVELFSRYDVGDVASVLEGMEFFVDNLTSMELAVEFVGRTITIQEVE